MTFSSAGAVPTSHKDESSEALPTSTDTLGMFEVGCKGKEGSLLALTTIKDWVHCHIMAKFESTDDK